MVCIWFGMVQAVLQHNGFKMPTLTELFIQNTIFSASYSGTYSGSQGISNLSSIFTENNDSFIKAVALDTTVNVSSGYNTYYKMQGWNPVTQKYEDWHSM